MIPLTQGRVISIEGAFLTVQGEKKVLRFNANEPLCVSLGDIVEISQNEVRLLTPNRTLNKSMRWTQKTLDPRRIHGMKTRSLVEAGIREFFLSKGFHETRTPLLVPCPGMEPHIRPFAIKSDHSLFLPTSPEFAMKRLLVGGLEKIFQICPAFRDEPNSATHRPEFTMLEWYRAFSGYEEIMKDAEELFYSIAMRLFGKPTLSFQGKEISVQPPWPRLKIRDLFLEAVGVDLVRSSTVDLLAKDCKRLNIPANPGETWDDLYFKIWLNLIEAQLPSHQAVFVTRYPASQAALSVIDSDPDGSRWARRFEVYAGGVELGNAFEELTDPVEQRRRFVEDMELRSEIYGPTFPKTPIDEEFLGALEEGMPPSGGIAVGVDRMVMLFANEADINYTLWL